MTRKSQMAIQEQELNKMKNKCESYKKSLAAVTKLVSLQYFPIFCKLKIFFFQCQDLKSTVAVIADINKNSAKIVKPKSIVRHVAVQVPVRLI
jgi:hypothetical protein